MRVFIKVKRFDVTKAGMPTWSTYEIDALPGEPILSCLDNIKDEQDGTLTFRENCRNAICGSCAMRINGKAGLACKQQVGQECKNQNTITLEPMGNMPVLKDLVVDMDPFWRSLERVNPFLLPNVNAMPEKEFMQTPWYRSLLSDVEKCIMCAACFSDCQSLSVDSKFLGPAALAKGYRYVADNRDAKYAQRLKDYDQPHGMWDCTHCFQCNEVCPVGVKPMSQILKLQRQAINQGYILSPGAKHHKAMVEIVNAKGILDENALAFKSVFPDIVGLLGLVPIGFRMLLARKLPPLIPNKLSSIEQVKKIMQASHKEFSEDPHGQHAADF